MANAAKHEIEIKKKTATQTNADTVLVCMIQSRVPHNYYSMNGCLQMVYPFIV